MVSSIRVQAARTEDDSVFNSLAEWLVPLVLRARLVQGKWRALLLGMPWRTGKPSLSSIGSRVGQISSPCEGQERHACAGTHTHMQQSLGDSEHVYTRSMMLWQSACPRRQAEVHSLVGPQAFLSICPRPGADATAVKGLTG